MTETFGSVVAEVMASGLVVLALNYVASEQSSAREGNGLPAAYGNEDAFLQQAVELAGKGSVQTSTNTIRKPGIKR